MALQTTDIRSVKDIELNLHAITSKLGSKGKDRINEIRRELEIELGFSQHEHLRFSESLEDFPGLSQQQIEDATQRGLNNPIEMYPKEITKHVEATTQLRSNQKHPDSNTLPDNNSRRSTRERENAVNNTPERQRIPNQRKNNPRVNKNS